MLQSTHEFFMPEDLAAIHEIDPGIVMQGGVWTLVHRFKIKSGEYIWVSIQWKVSKASDVALYCLAFEIVCK
jgi:hypothetical protein